MDTLTRLLVALALVALGVLAYAGWNRWQLGRLRRSRATAPGLEGWQPGLAGVLYFTTPDCAPCRTVQRPALAALSAELGAALQIVEVDASARPDVADHWGVLSVPTTFVLDGDGRPIHVNHGVAGVEKLKRQLAGARPPGSGPHEVALTVGP
jgi:thioredoxin 1